MKFEEYKNSIEHNFPDFKVEKIEKAGEGWDSQAFDVNGQYIFRFPKRDYVSENLQKEICLLPKLKSLVNISIPEFKFIGTQLNKFKFVGYKKIKGKLLSEESVLGLDNTLKKQLASDVIEFIKTIHAFSTTEAKNCGVVEENPYKYHTELLVQIREKVFPIVNQATQKHIEQLYSSYLNKKENFDYKPVLLHADLSFNHMIYDTARNRIVGVIDFGDVRIGDPEMEFRWFYHDDRDFFDMVHENFNNSNLAHLTDKFNFFNNFDAIYNIIHGLRYKEQDKIDWGTKELEKYVQS